VVVIEDRLHEQEGEVLAQLQILDDRLEQWQGAN
jgi:hypothetical protein